MRIVDGPEEVPRRSCTETERAQFSSNLEDENPTITETDHALYRGDVTDPIMQRSASGYGPPREGELSPARIGYPISHPKPWAWPGWEPHQRDQGHGRPAQVNVYKSQRTTDKEHRRDLRRRMGLEDETTSRRDRRHSPTSSTRSSTEQGEENATRNEHDTREIDIATTSPETSRGYTSPADNPYEQDIWPSEREPKEVWPPPGMPLEYYEPPATFPQNQPLANWPLPQPYPPPNTYPLSSLNCPPPSPGPPPGKPLPPVPPIRPLYPRSHWEVAESKAAWELGQKEQEGYDEDIELSNLPRRRLEFTKDQDFPERQQATPRAGSIQGSHEEETRPRGRAHTREQTDRPMQQEYPADKLDYSPRQSSQSEESTDPEGAPSLGYRARHPRAWGPRQRKLQEYEEDEELLFLPRRMQSVEGQDFPERQQASPRAGSIHGSQGETRPRGQTPMRGHRHRQIREEYLANELVYSPRQSLKFEESAHSEGAPSPGHQARHQRGREPYRQVQQESNDLYDDSDEEEDRSLQRWKTYLNLEGIRKGGKRIRSPTPKEPSSIEAHRQQAEQDATASGQKHHRRQCAASPTWEGPEGEEVFYAEMRRRQAEIEQQRKRRQQVSYPTSEASTREAQIKAEAPNVAPQQQQAEQDSTEKEKKRNRRQQAVSTAGETPTREEASIVALHQEQANQEAAARQQNRHQRQQAFSLTRQAPTQTWEDAFDTTFEQEQEQAKQDTIEKEPKDHRKQQAALPTRETPTQASRASEETSDIPLDLEQAEQDAIEREKKSLRETIENAVRRENEILSMERARHDRRPSSATLGQPIEVALRQEEARARERPHAQVTKASSESREKHNSERQKPVYGPGRPIQTAIRQEEAIAKVRPPVQVKKASSESREERTSDRQKPVHGPQPWTTRIAYLNKGVQTRHRKRAPLFGDETDTPTRWSFDSAESPVSSSSQERTELGVAEKERPVSAHMSHSSTSSASTLREDTWEEQTRRREQARSAPSSEQERFISVLSEEERQGSALSTRTSRRELPESVPSTSQSTFEERTLRRTEQVPSISSRLEHTSSGPSEEARPGPVHSTETSRHRLPESVQSILQENILKEQARRRGEQRQECTAPGLLEEPRPGSVRSTETSRYQLPASVQENLQQNILKEQKRRRREQRQERTAPGLLEEPKPGPALSTATLRHNLPPSEQSNLKKKILKERARRRREQAASDSSSRQKRTSSGSQGKTREGSIPSTRSSQRPLPEGVPRIEVSDWDEGQQAETGSPESGLQTEGDSQESHDPSDTHDPYDLDDEDLPLITETERREIVQIESREETGGRRRPRREIDYTRRLRLKKERQQNERQKENDRDEMINQEVSLWEDIRRRRDEVTLARLAAESEQVPFEMDQQRPPLRLEDGSREVHENVQIPAPEFPLNPKGKLIPITCP